MRADPMNRPFFRADQVGSLLRPAELLEARAQFGRRGIDRETLRSREDQAIRIAVKRQEEIGLPVVVDGEFRRENWWIDFVSALDGVEIHDGNAAVGFVAPKPATDDACCEDHVWSYVPKNVFTRSRIGRSEPVTVSDYEFLRSATSVTAGASANVTLAKVTLPSPTRMHFHGGRNTVSREAYPDEEEFFSDIAAVYRREIAALEAAGCRYIQIDDPLLTYFISDRLREEVRQAGDDPDARLRRYVQLTNECIAARRPDTAIGIHVCRGNSRSGWIAEGGYERIAETVLGGLQCDHLLLEFDDERSGDFRPLRHVPPGRRVVLGLVTTKRGALEDVDMLLRRIEDASAFMPLEDLAISPQCGFASVVEGNLITEDEQWAKLRLVVKVAQRVWGDVRPPASL